MNKSLKMLSDIIIYSKYGRYLKNKLRRETFNEITDRYLLMMINKYPLLEKEINLYGQQIKQYKILPSMRMLQFAGIPVEVNNARGYNCAFLPIDSYHSFSETMFLLLTGCGVGYSVQNKQVNKLPEIRKPTKERRFLVQDSIVGWSDAVKVLMKAYYGLGAKPKFDFRDIRVKGTELVTSGGKAPGPEPLKLCLFHIETILERKNNGNKLTPLEVHDIQCHIANAVLAGGIRRAAMIALFDFDNEEMITSKYGSWWELNEQRGRANNSAVTFRTKIKEKAFKQLWKRIELSGSGEPGIYLTNDPDWGTNPCCEIGLRPYQFCNLTELNVSDIEDEDDILMRVEAAAFFGTLQASFTDFHYLRSIWEHTTKKDALIGIGMTGIASNKILQYDLKKLANHAKVINRIYAKQIGINEAARITTIKPSGTTSCVLGTSSGIHAWHSKYYLRTVRFNKNEAIAQYLINNHPEICEDDLLRPQDTVCIRIPIEAPDNSILREDENAIKQLERVKYFYTNWIKNGHRNGTNTHNVSATISVKQDEWENVGNWMWNNKKFYNGLSVLPYDGGTYSQAPFETITKEIYDEKVKQIKDIDLRNVIEIEDGSNLAGEIACGSDGCIIT